MSTLAADGPLNGYKVWAKLVKKEAVTQPTIRGDLEELLKRHAVRTVTTDREARGGRPSRYYELTLPGLATVIASLDDNEKGHEFLNGLAKKYRDLAPSVFDVWPAILENGIGDLAFRRLQEICISEVETGAVWKHPSDLLPGKVHAEFFTPQHPYLEETPADRKRWFQGTMRNSTLRERMKASVRDRIWLWELHLKNAKAGIKNAEAMLKAISQKEDDSN